MNDNTPMRPISRVDGEMTGSTEMSPSAPELILEPTSQRSLPSRILNFIRRRIVWLFVIIFLIWTVGPLYWTISASFMRLTEVFFFNLYPESPTLQGYRQVLSRSMFTTFLGNSLFLAITTTVTTVVISALAAFAFSRYLFPFRHALLLLILVPRLVPRISLVVPLFVLLNAIGLLDTRAALMITYTASAVPLATWVLIGFFNAVPKELDEAATVDGAGTFQRLIRIVMPIAVPGLITVAVFAFRESWNEFPFALTFTSGADQRTLPYALFLLNDQTGLPDWPMINAFAILTMVPILLLYLFFERHVVSGITKGAID